MSQLRLFEQEPVEVLVQTIPASSIDASADLGTPDEAFLESIKQFGMLNLPLVQKQNGRYIPIAGKRRVRALMEAGAEEIECRVLPEGLSEQASAVLRLTENMQRSENWVDELEAIEVLLQAGKTQKEIARIVGKSSTVIAQRLELQDLIPGFLDALRKRQISYSQARSILKLDEERQNALWTVFGEKGRITHEEIQGQIQARREVDFDALPDDLFVDPTTDWQREVRSIAARLTSLANTVPEGVRDAVAGAAKMLQEAA